MAKMLLGPNQVVIIEVVTVQRTRLHFGGRYRYKRSLHIFTSPPPPQILPSTPPVDVIAPLEEPQKGNFQSLFHFCSCYGKLMSAVPEARLTAVRAGTSIVSQARLSITERGSGQIQLRESFLLSQHTCLNDGEISCINESGTGRHTLIRIRIDQGRYGYTHSVTCLRMPSVKNPDSIQTSFVCEFAQTLSVIESGLRD